MRTLLVTGGAGFIGSHLIDHLLETYPDYKIINVDKLTYAGNLENLKKASQNARYHFIQADINDKPQLDHLFSTYDFYGIFHLAAESHVDNSIKGPGEFIQTNICGTFQLLEKARERHAQNKPIRFLHVSTDEVYGSLGETGFFTETSQYQPNSPYSASKASSDMLVRSYFKTYGLDTVISNCSNNFGPRQHHEKLIPTVITKAIAGQSIPVYGQGLNVRDWLYVTEHCKALDLVFHQGSSGEVYNIGTHHELSNIELVRHICKILDRLVPGQNSFEDQIVFVDDRAGHDFRYAIDASKIKQLGWQDAQDFEGHLEKTLVWYLDHMSESMSLTA